MKRGTTAALQKNPSLQGQTWCGCVFGGKEGRIRVIQFWPIRMKREWKGTEKLMEGWKEGNSPVGRCGKNRWTLWYTYTSYSHETETGILSWDFFVYVFFPPDPSPYRRQTLITFSRHQKNILGDFRTHSVEVLKLLHPPSFPLLSWKPTFGPFFSPACHLPRGIYNEASPANAVHLHTDIDNPKKPFLCFHIL